LATPSEVSGQGRPVRPGGDELHTAQVDGDELLDDSVHVLERDVLNGAIWVKVLHVLYEGGWLAENYGRWDLLRAPLPLDDISVLAPCSGSAPVPISQWVPISRLAPFSRGRFQAIFISTMTTWTLCRKSRSTRLSTVGSLSHSTGTSITML